jgi:DNA end-binding protein Ku
LPKRARSKPSEPPEGAPSVRSIWSGNLTFGLVSIPVEMFAAVRPRQKAMKMVDKDGHPLGRQYHCSADGKELSANDLVRGYQSDSGEMVVISDEEFESLAPETSGDIDLIRFVPQQQIPPIFYDRPYFLAPSGRSAKAYNLLAKSLERAERVAIGTFVMRGHEYLVAIVSDNGVLRADTLRRAN